MTESELRFCPFCKQAFEGIARCPEHELMLVAAHRLPRSPSGSEDLVSFLELGRGRLLVLIGALAILAGFVAPTFVDATGRLAPLSGLSAAIATAPVLWLVPAAGGLLASLVLRRHRVVDLRSARIALLGLAMIAAVVELYVVRRVAVAESEHALGGTVTLGPGVVLVFAGATVAAMGAVLLGRARSARR
ncbi:MAG: hypothetical protein H5U40_03455 [Polyangiaceae bacterium]|nr:hypothetical protein [Polyangiaceae bacterium]